VNLGKLTGNRSLLESGDGLSTDVQSAGDIDYFDPAASAPSPNCRSRQADLFSPKVDCDQIATGLGR
jgi:hypothetical protein